MQNGIVKSWDDMDLVWDHTFREQLRIDPTDTRILLTGDTHTCRGKTIL